MSRMSKLASFEAMTNNILSTLDSVAKWDVDIEKIAENDKSFTEIDWDYLGIEGDVIEKLAVAMKGNSYLEKISLCGNNVDDNAVIVLCKAIRKNKSMPLTDLNLSFNQITKESSAALESIMLRSGLYIQLFGTDIEKEIDMSGASLRQTKKPTTIRRSVSEKKEKKAKTKRSKARRSNTQRRSMEGTKSPKTPESESPRTPEEDPELDELEKELQKLQEDEQDYILDMEDLERKMIGLMQEKTNESIKGSSGIFGDLLKIKRSLTLEKKNIVITRKLAEIGGSGAGVYSCLVDGWKCAMKELDTTHMSKYSIDGFMSEIRLLELLPQNENISRYLFHEISGNRIRLFMTQYHGSLGGYIQDKATTKKKFSPLQIWTIALDIIKGIEFLHSNGIIHRDLKSDNIFILLSEKNEILKSAIGDFDTAKQVSKSEQAKTVLGTPAWMAPEVMDAKALGNYSYSCDVYSFGMIIYELLYLKMPYAGMNPMRIPMMVLQGQRPDEPPVDESYVDLFKLYEKCVDFKPKKRPSVKKVKSIIANNLIKG